MCVSCHNFARGLALKVIDRPTTDWALYVQEFAKEDKYD